MLLACVVRIADQVVLVGGQPLLPTACILRSCLDSKPCLASQCASETSTGEVGAVSAATGRVPNVAFIRHPKPCSAAWVRRRHEQEWGGRSLQELQRPHKSRLLREQEEWAERVRCSPARDCLSILLSSCSLAAERRLQVALQIAAPDVTKTSVLGVATPCVCHAVGNEACERTQADRAHTAREVAGGEGGCAEFHEGAAAIPLLLLGRYYLRGTSGPERSCSPSALCLCLRCCILLSMLRFAGHHGVHNEAH